VEVITMATGVQVTFDCADPQRLAGFWQAALGYQGSSPPEGYASWPDFARDRQIPESDWNNIADAIDPAGQGPRLLFQKVPEPKTTKNRVHLDINAGAGQPPEQRRSIVRSEVARLVGLGAAELTTFDQHGEFWVVLRDPEGNEFCVQ
jgi:hypothetical protein